MRRIGWLFASVFIGGLVLILLLAPGSFGPLGWDRGSGSYGWGMAPWVWGGFGFPIMGFVMLFFCLFMMGGMMHGGHPMHSTPRSWVSRPRESLSDILERRYSQGEITKDEFEEMKQALNVSDNSSSNEHAHR